MGLHSINNQCFHNISASLFLQNLIYILHTFQIQYRSNYERHTREFVMLACTYNCLCVASILTILLILYPTSLFKKCVPCCGYRGWDNDCKHLLNHFRDSTMMEAMVIVTSGWFLDLSSSSGYELLLHS